MQNSLDRRSFLKTTAGTAIGLAALDAARLAAAEAPKGTPHAEKLGWRLGCTLYSFNRYSFEEAVEMNAGLGLRFAEGFTWQKLSKDDPKTKTDPALSPAQRQQMKKKLADCGVKLLNTYCQFGKDEAAGRKMFEFAKDLGIETLICEPPLESLDMVEKLCDEYQVNVAIHNHPKPNSQYWNPATLAKACKGRGKRIGACADTGHWMRSGITALDGVKMLADRILTFHFKDLNEFGNPKAYDVPWGTGVGKFKDLLAEIRRLKIKAFFGIEYERDLPDKRPEIAKCVTWFEKTAAELR